MDNLPEVNGKDLPIFNFDEYQCAGYLSKKASKSSAFSKGKWQKRWFSIEIDIKPDSNYYLDYSYSPEDRKIRQSYALSNASIKIAGGNSFILTLSDGSNVILSADNSEDMKDWVQSLEKVIAVATARENFLNPDNDADEVNSNIVRHIGDEEDFDEDNTSHQYTSTFKKEKPIQKGSGGHVLHSAVESHRMHKRSYPTLRLDMDVNLIPPGSTDRHQFIGLFTLDVAKALNIYVNFIDIISVRPAPGMDWLTEIEFDIRIVPDEHASPDQIEQDENQRIELRSNLLFKLHELLIDTSSHLFNGFITSKLDPTFSLHLVDNTQSHKSEMDRDPSVIPFSIDPEVLKIMHKYKDVQVPSTFVDKSHISITLHFEGRTLLLSVLNPKILKERDCALWPFEVKEALGFMGTMQELWVEPTALLPMNQSKYESEPIYFQPSVRVNDCVLINANRLKDGLSYEVQCEDKRDEALNSLTVDEMSSIKETFQKYDINGDGGISRMEMEELVRLRCLDRKTIIEEKYREYINDPNTTRDEKSTAEYNKARYLQQVQESQTKLMKMFEAADLNGDGVISFTEFIMAEAWWLRCTLNPTRAHLF